MKRILLLLIFVTSVTFAQAQRLSVTGAVHSVQTKESLPGASVLLIRVADSVKTATGTDKDGVFRFNNLTPGQYAVQVNYVGHKLLAKTIRLENTSINLGQLSLEESAITTKEIVIEGQIPLGTQKGDTTVFNAAAFKVADDASAEDLVTKLPGVTVVDGKIQAQGEEVRQVLVDGKRFFGEDANTALRNLPAEVIENIEIFDKKSDQAEFSGFDDGNRSKTINIVTKQNRRQGQFGKVSVGVGPGEKYMAGTSMNIFKGTKRLTVNGLTNNINMQDFSVGEAPGGGMRGRRGGGGGGGGNGGGGSGIATTNTFGLNYTDEWGKKIEVSGNYNYSNSSNENNRKSQTQLLNSRYFNQRNIDTTDSESGYESHSFNFRLEYKINDRNRLLVSPRLSIQKNDSWSESKAKSIFDNNRDTESYEEELINQRYSLSQSDNYSYSLNNNINFSHRFDKPGRTFSAGLNTTNTVNDGNTYAITDIIAATPTYLNQHIKSDREGLTWRGNVALGERVSDKARIQADYSISNRFENSSRLAYDSDKVSNDWNEITYSTVENTRLSNSFESAYMTQVAKTSYLYNSDKLRLQAEAQYQVANLRNEQEKPVFYQMDRTFYNFLPTAQIEYKFTKTKNIQLDYRTSTDAPSVTQLQEVIDNTNPLRFRTGNDELKQAFQNSLNLRYRSFDTETNRVFSFFITAAKTDDYITNSSTEYNLDKIEELNGIQIPNGAQFTRPVNLDGNWNARTFFSYGQPLSFIKSNFNITGSAGINRTPGTFNDTLYFSNSNNYGLGISLSSNISQNVDFNFSTNSRYSIATNNRPTKNPDTNKNESFNQSTQLRANIKFWKGVVYRTELSHQLNAGLSTNFNTNYTLLNMSLSKKVLKSQKGELSLSVNDLLRQNLSIQRNVSANAISDSETTVLQRFFMLTFSYNIRNFAGGAPGGRGQGGERTPGERGNMRQGGGFGGEGGGFGGQGGGRNRQ